MSYAVLLFMCVVFIELFILFHITDRVKITINLSMEAIAVLINSDISDDEKEVFMKRRSIELLKATFVFSVLLFSIFIFLYLIYLGIVYIKPELGIALIDAMKSLTMIGVLTVFAFIYIWVRNVIRRQL